VFERSEIIDRNPPPPPAPGEPELIHVSAKATFNIDTEIARLVNRSSYPTPPSDFALDADVDTLWQRWTGYLAGRESLQQMAYFCLTVLQMHGGRTGAAQRFAVSERVLATLAQLSTETGDALTARKMTQNFRAATDDERAWLEAAVKALIRRAGEVAADPAASPLQLTKADLPTL
jgi:hypothetical protein